ASVWGTGVAQQEDASLVSQAPRGPTPLPFEIAAFGGYTWGGSFKAQNPDQSFSNYSLQNKPVFPVAFDWRFEDTRAYELFYSRESTHFGGNGVCPQTDMTV